MNENPFMNHRCRERDRIEELRSSVGQAAYAHYAEWMRVSKKSVPPIETFAESRYYSTFVKFAEHALKSNIPNVKQFIRLMVEHNNVSPGLWCRDNVYAMYLQWYDQAYRPEIQVIESIDFMKTLVQDYETTTTEIFKQIPLEILIQHVRRRKLSPWFLMASRVFREFVVSLSEFDADQVKRATNWDSMIVRIQQNQAMFKLFGEAAAEEGF